MSNNHQQSQPAYHPLELVNLSSARHNDKAITLQYNNHHQCLTNQKSISSQLGFPNVFCHSVLEVVAVLMDRAIRSLQTIMALTSRTMDNIIIIKAKKIP